MMPNAFKMRKDLSISLVHIPIRPVTSVKPVTPTLEQAALPGIPSPTPPERLESQEPPGLLKSLLRAEKKADEKEAEKQ